MHGDVGLDVLSFVPCACCPQIVKRVRIMENPPTSGPALITSLGKPSNGSKLGKGGWEIVCRKITQLHVVNDID